MKLRLINYLLNFLLFVMLTSCGAVEDSVFVESVPTGAQILDAQGKPMGLTTPSYVKLNSEIDSHLIKIDLPGYKQVPMYFNRYTETEFIGVGEVAGSIICAPCCCGLPLLNLLDPVDVNTRFVPERVQVNLERTGGGIHLRVFPPTAKLIVDGVSRGQLFNDQEVFIPLKEGKHRLEFEAPGFERIHAIEDVLIDEQTEVRLNIKMEAVESGFYIKKSPAKVINKVEIFSDANSEYADYQYDVEKEGWIIHQIPPGEYIVVVKGRTSLDQSLQHRQPLKIRENKLTILDARDFLEWKKIEPFLGVTFEGSKSIKSGGEGSIFEIVEYPKIEQIYVGSPAYRAGLRTNDIVLGLNGQEFGRRKGFRGVMLGVNADVTVNSGSGDFMSRLKTFLNGFKPGQSLIIDVEREGKIFHLKVDKLGSHVEVKWEAAGQDKFELKRKPTKVKEHHDSRERSKKKSKKVSKKYY